MIRSLLFLLVTVGCTVFGNFLLKTGAVQSAGLPGLAGLLNARVVSGLAMFACGVLAYVVALRVIPLSVAQSVATLQFVCVILMSALVLGESISRGQWIGMGLIVAGLAVVAWSTRAS